MKKTHLVLLLHFQLRLNSPNEVFMNNLQRVPKSNSGCAHIVTFLRLQSFLYKGLVNI